MRKNMMYMVLKYSIGVFSIVLLYSCSNDDYAVTETMNTEETSSRLRVSETIITEDGNTFQGNLNEAANWGEGLDKLNDGNYSTKYFARSGEVSVMYNVLNHLIPSSYIIVSGNDSYATYRDPVEWTVYGYYAGKWEVIDSQYQQYFSRRSTGKVYSLNTSKPYTSYYFSFKTNSNEFELGEIQVVASSNENPDPDPDPENSFTFNYNNYNQYDFSYENYNSSGSNTMRNIYTVDRIRNLLNNKANDIANLLYYTSNDISNQLKLNEFIVSKDDGAAWSIGNTNTWNNYGSTIWISEKFIEEKYKSLSYSDFLKEVDGVIVHEMTHTLSIGYSNSNQDSSQYVEGIADYCRIKLGYRSPDASSGVHRPVASNSIYSANPYNIAWFILYIEKEKDAGFAKKLVKYYNSHSDFTWNAAMNHFGLNLITTWNEFVNYINYGGTL